ncbi:hypothetical protein BKA81DRAFT_119783 [Phyllosticta paracitricarpa]
MATTARPRAKHPISAGDSYTRSIQLHPRSVRPSIIMCEGVSETHVDVDKCLRLRNAQAQREAGHMAGFPGAPGTAGTPGHPPFEEPDKSRQWSVLKLKQRRRETIGCVQGLLRHFRLEEQRAVVVKDETHVRVPRLSPARCGELRESGTRHCGSAQHHGCTLCSSLCTCTDQGRRRVPNLTSSQAKRRHLDGHDC